MVDKMWYIFNVETRPTSGCWKTTVFQHQYPEVGFLMDDNKYDILHQKIADELQITASQVNFLRTALIEKNTPIENLPQYIEEFMMRPAHHPHPKKKTRNHNRNYYKDLQVVVETFEDRDWDVLTQELV